MRIGQFTIGLAWGHSIEYAIYPAMYWEPDQYGGTLMLCIWGWRWGLAFTRR